MKAIVEIVVTTTFVCILAIWAGAQMAHGANDRPTQIETGRNAQWAKVQIPGSDFGIHEDDVCWDFRAGKRAHVVVVGKYDHDRELCLVHRR